MPLERTCRFPALLTAALIPALVKSKSGGVLTSFIASAAVLTAATPTIVSLTSVLPRHPAPRMDTVDAVVCTLPADVCTQWTLPGWTAVAYPGVTVLLREKR